MFLHFSKWIWTEKHNDARVTEFSFSSFAGIFMDLQQLPETGGTARKSR